MPRKPDQRQRQLAAIKAARGSLRRAPGGPSFAERMAAFKAEERALEQRREDCLATLRARPRDQGTKRPRDQETKRPRDSSET
jgi:hypothetical protein